MFSFFNSFLFVYYACSVVEDVLTNYSFVGIQQLFWLHKCFSGELYFLDKHAMTLGLICFFVIILIVRMENFWEFKD